MISGQYIKKLAENAGFDLCGITPCKHLAENESYFREWLAKGYGSSLEYLERNLDKRFDVRRLVEGAQTVVVCAVSYKTRWAKVIRPGVAQKSPPTPATATTTPSSRGCWARCSKPCAGNTPGSRAACSSIRLRCWKNNWPSKRVWAGSGGNPCCSRPNTVPMSCWASWYLPCRPTSTMPRSQEPVAAVPELPGQLSDGSHRRAQGDRHEPLHLLSYDRKGVRQRPARPRRMDLRLRSLPELLSPQPKSPHAPLAAFRSPVRPADDFGSGVARNERRGVSPAVRQYTSRTQRTAAHPAKRADKPGKERRVGPAIGRRGRQQTDPKPLRILSAGCSGNLPYERTGKPEPDRPAHRHRPDLRHKGSRSS